MLNFRFLTIISLLFLSVSLVGQTDPGAMLKQADQLQKSGSHEESIDLYKKFLTTYPDRRYDAAQVHYKLAEQYFALGLFTPAQHHNDTSADLRRQLFNEELGNNSLFNTRFQLHQKNWTAAETEINRARGLPSADPAYYAEVELLASEVSVKKGDLSTAIEQTHRAGLVMQYELGIGPELIQIYLREAQLHVAQGDERSAAKSLMNAYVTAQELDKTSDLGIWLAVWLKNALHQ